MRAFAIRRDTPLLVTGAALLLAAILCSACGAMAAAVPGQVLFEGHFLAADYQWQHDDSGRGYPVLEGARSLGEPGLPKLPQREILLLVPMDSEVARVWVEPVATHREVLTAGLSMAGDITLSSGESLSTRTMVADAASFPAAWSRSGGTHIWRGYRLLTVTVYPVREVDRQGTPALEYLDSYAIRAEFTAATDVQSIVQRERFVPGELAENTRVLAGVVANPSELRSYRRDSGQVSVVSKGGGFQPTLAPSLTGSGVSYLIITNTAMAPAFQVLADFKTSMGLSTVVVTREEIAATSRNGADIQETIRMYIRDAYAKWGVSYVLLGGDSDIIPPRYIDNNFYPANGFTTIPCDLYFACLDGNWNADGDSHFGEPLTLTSSSDVVDFAEEVYLGRAAVSNPAAAAVFVNKVMTYELTGAASAWPNRTLFAAEILFPSEYIPGGYIILDGAQYSDQQVNNHILPCTTMEYMRMYETNAQNPWDAPLSRAALIDTLNTGHYGIFNQIGHGYYFNMSVGDANFMTTDADALTNGDHTFLIFALNCASGAFDNSCLLERFVQNPNGGAVAALGSARAAFPNASNNYQQEFFNDLYCGSGFRVGQLMAISRLPFIGSTNFNAVDRWTFENYTLLGDPTVGIWTGQPQAVVMTGPTSLAPGPNTVTYTVSVGGNVVAGALVCLEKPGEDIATGVTDSLGQVALAFLPVSTGNAVLTVTGKNLAHTTMQIPVMAGSSYLALSAMPFVDDGTAGSIGNANAIVDAGETLALSPVFLETGGTGETGLSATLTADSPLVTVSVGTVALADVLAGGVTSVVSPFVVHFDPTISDGTEVIFTMNITGAGGTYVTRWPATVVRPEIEVTGLDWDDAVYGNGNGLLDNSERYALTVSLKNFGSGVADLVNARLRSIKANVTVNDSVGTWTTLAPMNDSTGANTFSLTISLAVRANDSYLVFTDNYGRVYRHDFALPRPDAPLNLLTDTSLGSDVIGISWTPATSPTLLGYNVYRSLSPGGPFVRVNSDVVAGTAYYRDENLALLTKYYYQVASVDSSRVPSVPSLVVGQATAPAEVSGFPVAFAQETSSHLAVGDVDGDGDLEIVLASDQVYVWHHTGMELLDGDHNSQTLGNFTNYPTGTVLQPAAVTLANLDNIPGVEIIVSERSPGNQIHIFRFDGTELSGWPQTTGGVAGSSWNWASPAVGDIDGDGVEEIVVNTLNGIVWAWHSDGTEVRDGDGNPATNGVFYVRPGATWEWSRSGPALYDLDGDGAKDIIFGTKNDASGLKRLMALKFDGTDVLGFPYVAVGPISCNPAVGDLNNDGIAEIVFYDKNKRVYAVQQDGTDYPGFPKLTTIFADAAWVGSPALADMDGDGMLEIIYTPNVSGLLSKLCVMDTDYLGGTAGAFLPGFPVDLPGSSEGSPIVGDIDGDGVPEVLHGIGGGDESSPYNLYAYHATGLPVNGFPITLGGPLMASVTVTDIDQDLDVDIVYGGWDFKTHVWDMPFAYDRHNVPWPTFAGNVKRDGVFFPLALVGVDDGDQVPSAGFTVMNPYPNPFNPSTRVRLYIPTASDLDLGVYDIAGRKVRTLHTGGIARGWHTLVWDGQDDAGRGQSSGMYFMRAVNGGHTTIRKMTLVK